MLVKPLTDTDIRESLGLLPHLDFLKNAIFNVRHDAHLKWLREFKNVEPSAEDFFRGSGRTTEMLIKALIALSEGEKVAVVGYDTTYTANLTRDLIDRAMFLGLPSENIVKLPRPEKYSPQRPSKSYPPAVKVFYDHYYKL